MAGFFIFAGMQQDFRKTYTVDEAKRKLEQYCAYQDRCHEEVLQKLRGMNMIPQAIDTITAHLIEHNFLNEERFAKSFARGKFRIKYWGRVRITRELKARGISKYNLDSALKEINDAEYFSVFEELSQKQWDSIREANIQKRKKKLFDFLMRKGFESNLVYDRVHELTNNNI